MKRKGIEGLIIGELQRQSVRPKPQCKGSNKRQFRLLMTRYQVPTLLSCESSDERQAVAALSQKTSENSLCFVEPGSILPQLQLSLYSIVFCFLVMLLFWFRFLLCCCLFCFFCCFLLVMFLFLISEPTEMYPFIRGILVLSPVSSKAWCIWDFQPKVNSCATITLLPKRVQSDRSAPEPASTTGQPQREKQHLLQVNGISGECNPEAFPSIPMRLQSPGSHSDALLKTEL